MIMPWSLASTCMCGISAVTSSFTAVYLRQRTHKYNALDQRKHVSSVRWVFCLFFMYVALWSVARFAKALWIWHMVTHPHDAAGNNLPEEVANHHNADRLYNHFECLGMQAVHWLRNHSTVSMTIVMCCGDTALFGLAICTFPLARELSYVAKQCMDDGAAREQRKIQMYNRCIHGLVGIYIGVQSTFAIYDHGYSERNHHCKLVAYVVQLISFVFMAISLWQLKWLGRKFEPVQGVWLKSPLYTRLKRIMLIYAFCACQFQISSCVLYIRDAMHRSPNTKNTSSTLHQEPNGLIVFSGISVIMYAATGFLLGITTGCSQRCVIKLLSCWIPEDLEAQLLDNGRLPLRMSSGLQRFGSIANEILPPTEDPVFVCTDIESSSALWAIADGKYMQEATEIHDTILRSLLAKYQGYEITTCGDSFHLVFSSIDQAVAYCLDVQQTLLRAPWPKQLHNLIPATATKRTRTFRPLVRGLRVRMGIHDSHSSDGNLVCRPHDVTGRMTYTGASEVIAQEVADLGDGGQILITRRIAAYLSTKDQLVVQNASAQSDLSDAHVVMVNTTKCEIALVGSHVCPQLQTTVEVFQLNPLDLLGRKQYFTMAAQITTIGKRTMDNRHCGLLSTIAAPNLQPLRSSRDQVRGSYIHLSSPLVQPRNS